MPDEAWDHFAQQEEPWAAVKVDGKKLIKVVRLILRMIWSKLNGDPNDIFLVMCFPLGDSNVSQAMRNDRFGPTGCRISFGTPDATHCFDTMIQDPTSNCEYQKRKE